MERDRGIDRNDFDFPEPLLDEDEDPTDPHEAQQKAELDVIYRDLEARKKALFEASPVCAVCPKPILSLGKATVFTPAGGKDVLIHADRGECFVKALHASMGRYMAKPRRAVA